MAMIRLASQPMKLRLLAAIIAFSVFTATDAIGTGAETGYEAWLRYAPLEKALARKYDGLPANAIAAGDSLVLRSALQELIRGFQGMLGVTLAGVPRRGGGPAIILGTIKDLRDQSVDLRARR